MEEARNLFKEKCTKNGGPGAFENAEQAQLNMVQCLQSLINITELQAEMEKYKPTGDLDIVFKNYCDKRSNLRACVNNFTNTVEHCLDEKERENKKIVLNITDSLLQFICYKEGDRIARKFDSFTMLILKIFSDSRNYLSKYLIEDFFYVYIYC